MLVIGDIVWVVTIPLAFLVREPAGTPAQAAATVDGVEGPEMTVAQALRTPQFIALAAAHFACCAAHSGPIFHMSAAKFWQRSIKVKLCLELEKNR